MFFLFHSLCNADEAASVEERAEKVLFFYPYTCGIEQQLSQIGTCESLIALSQKFYPTSLCNTFQTTENQYSFLQYGSGTWLVLGIPNLGSDTDDALLYRKCVTRGFLHSIFEIVTLFYDSRRLLFTGFNSKVYHRGRVVCQSRAANITATLLFLRKRLRRSYSAFASQSGRNISSGGGCDVHISSLRSYPSSHRVCTLAATEILVRFNPENNLRQRLRMIISTYLTTFEQHFFFAKRGLSFLPIDKAAILRVHHIMASVLESVHIHHAALFYSGHVAWSTLLHRDLTLLCWLLFANEAAEYTFHENNVRFPRFNEAPTATANVTETTLCSATTPFSAGFALPGVISSVRPRSTFRPTNFVTLGRF